MVLSGEIANGPSQQAFSNDNLIVFNPERLLGTQLINAINFKPDEYKNNLSHKNIVLNTKFSIYGQKVSGPTEDKIMEKILLFPDPSFCEVKTVDGEKKLVIYAFLLEGEDFENTNKQYCKVFPVKNPISDNLYTALQLSADLELAEELLTENQT